MGGGQSWSRGPEKPQQPQEWQGGRTGWRVEREDRQRGWGREGLVGGHRRLNGQATYPGAKGAEMMERKHQNQEFEVLVRTRIMFITPFVKK